MPNRSAIPIQLAIQGGGAKISALLAAAEYFQSQHDEGEIEITRVAGTSAGAIVACLLASGIPIGETRKELKSLGKDDLAGLLPGLSWRRIVWRVGVRNLPLADIEALRRLLHRFFDEKGLKTLGDLNKASGIQAMITATDVSNGEMIVHRDHSLRIANCLLDSCALPFVFRTGSSQGQQVIVDGGICENLPSHILDEEEDSRERYGQIVGLSFERPQPKQPKSSLEFAKQLLNTAICNSMDRARQHIGEESVFSIKTDLTLLDFDEALSEALGGPYELAKLQTEKWFGPFLDSTKRAEGMETVDPLLSYSKESFMTTLSGIYQKQQERRPIEFTRYSMTVRANCLPSGDDAPSAVAPDEVHEEFVFDALDEPVWMIRLGISSWKESAFLPSWHYSVFDSDGQKVPCEILPSLTKRSPVEGKKKHEFIVFFCPPLPPRGDGKGPYTVTFADQVLFGMKKLAAEGVDHLAHQARRSFESPHPAELVLFVPKAFGRLHVEKLERPDLSCVDGRQLRVDELVKYNSPPGFEKFGWQGVLHQVDDVVGASFRKC